MLWKMDRTHPWQRPVSTSGGDASARKDQTMNNVPSVSGDKLNPCLVKASWNIGMTELRATFGLG